MSLTPTLHVIFLFSLHDSLFTVRCRWLPPRGQRRWPLATTHTSHDSSLTTNRKKVALFPTDVYQSWTRLSLALLASCAAVCLGEWRTGIGHNWYSIRNIQNGETIFQEIRRWEKKNMLYNRDYRCYSLTYKLSPVRTFQSLNTKISWKLSDHQHFIMTSLVW